MTRWSSRTNLLSAIAAVFALSLFFILGRAIAITLPAGFVSENAFPSLSFELPVQVDRISARFAAWYELFPRSKAGCGRCFRRERSGPLLSSISPRRFARITTWA